MHKSLQITDIVLDIVKSAYEILDDDDSPEVANGRVLALALTCHAFLEPALDMLWSAQGSLDPLLSCFSSKVIRTGDSETDYVRRRW